MPVKFDESKRQRAPRNQQPTIRQAKALQNIAMGMSRRKAMIKAGYTNGTATHNGHILMQSRAFKLALQGIISQLEKKGLNTDFYTDKIVEFTNAVKIHSSHTEPDRMVPDYNTQIQGIKMYEKLREKAEEQRNPQIKRKITFEEFVTGKEDVRASQ